MAAAEAFASYGNLGPGRKLLRYLQEVADSDRT